MLLAGTGLAARDLLRRGPAGLRVYAMYQDGGVACRDPLGEREQTGALRLAAGGAGLRTDEFGDQRITAGHVVEAETKMRRTDRIADEGRRGAFGLLDDDVAGARGLGFAGVEDASAAGGEAKSGTAQPALQRRMRFGSGLRHFNGQNAPPDPVKSRGIQQSSCQSRKSPGF